MSRFSFSISFASKALAAKGENLFAEFGIQVVKKLQYPGSIQYYMLTAPNKDAFDNYAAKLGARKTGASALLLNS